MERVLRAFSRLTEGIAAALLAAMFATFLLQIFSRYVMVQPLGWTLELCLILWVWIVFFGCAFVVGDRDHVRFDILVLAVPRGPRRWLAAAAALSVAAGLLWSLAPTWDYIDWMKIRRTSTVEMPWNGDKIRLKWVFVIYAVFLVAVAARALWAAWSALRHGPPPDPGPDGHPIDRGDEAT